MQQKKINKIPRVLISALKGGSGKTLVTIGIIAAWKKQNKNIISYKKGPDFIDSQWLSEASESVCYNLDTFLTSPNYVQQSFITHSQNYDISIIEANRGLFDGLDVKGSASSSELAKLLKIPVILCVDCTKSTRTIAAEILGCIKFDSEVKIKGIILNRIAGPRHGKIIKDCIDYYCKIPVVGIIPKIKKQFFPERHMGLVPTFEHSLLTNSIDHAAEIAKQYLDLDEIEKIAINAPSLENISSPKTKPLKVKPKIKTDIKPTIGVLKDSAFQFYYPENLAALKNAGAELVFISPLKDKKLPKINGLYIGGGFPETHANELANNISFKKDVYKHANQGLPIYAECGGLMYMGKSLTFKDNNSYEMVGFLPFSCGFSKKPQGHGYTILKVEKKNPFFEIGDIIKGHEFHYSTVLDWEGSDSNLVFSMQRGNGFLNKKDGVFLKNVIATYTHLHSAGTPNWAKSFVKNAVSHKNKF